jgi:PAS domain S-box-containing protein
VVFVPRRTDSGDGLAGLVASFVDVTQQQRVEQALAVEHDAAHAYLNVAGVIVVALDHTGRIVFVNRKGCELLGCDREEAVLGTPWIETFVPERARAETRDVLDTLWTGDVEAGGSRENWVLTKTGEERLVEWSNAVLRDPAGAVRAVVGTGIDVTERRRAEEARRRSEAEAQQQADLISALYRDAPIGLALIDRSGNVARMNRRFAALNGYAYEDAPARPIEEVVPGVAASIRALAEQVFERGDPVLQQELQDPVAGPRAGGRTWLVNCSPVHSTDDAVEFVQVILLDVTERRRLEAEVLRVTDEERHRIGRDLHDGLGSHLTGLGMLARSLARKVRRGQPATPDELDEIAQQIKAGAEQARALARGLDPADVRGEGLPRALARLAEDTSALADLDCSFDGPPALPPLPPATATQLYWIAQEAVTNALKHADATRIAITVGIENEGGQAPSTFVLAVRDDGRGLDGGHPEAASENGMGLRTMTYRAHLIGATLAVSSGEGVTVTCRLPLTSPS